MPRDRPRGGRPRGGGVQRPRRRPAGETRGAPASSDSATARATGISGTACTAWAASRVASSGSCPATAGRCSTTSAWRRRARDGSSRATSTSRTRAWARCGPGPSSTTSRAAMAGPSSSTTRARSWLVMRATSAASMPMPQIAETPRTSTVAVGRRARRRSIVEPTPAGTVVEPEATHSRASCSTNSGLPPVRSRTSVALPIAVAPAASSIAATAAVSSPASGTTVDVNAPRSG